MRNPRNKTALLAMPALAAAAIVGFLSTADAMALRHSPGIAMPRSIGLGHVDNGARLMRVEPGMDRRVLGGAGKSGFTSIAPETGNGPDPQPHKPRWKNQQGGLLGGMWPPPRRHPCSVPGGYHVPPGCP